MRKALAILAMVLAFTGLAYAQTWYTANQVTVAWDAVSKIKPDDTIKYQIYTKVGASGTPVKVGNEITSTGGTISFSVEGRYFIGVETVRYPVGETVGIKSATISWSNDAAVCAAAGPFGAVYYVAPGGAGGLRIVP